MKKVFRITSLLLMAVTLLAAFASCTESTTAYTEAESSSAAETEEKMTYEEKALGLYNVAPEGFAYTTATQTKSEFSNLNINDGRNDTVFVSSAVSDTLTVTIDLTREYSVGKISVIASEEYRNNAPSGFSVRFSKDMENFTDSMACEGTEISLGENQSARYVLIAFETVGGRVAFSEIEIFASVTTSDNMVLDISDITLYKAPDTEYTLSVKRYRDGRQVNNELLTFASSDADIVAVDETGRLTPVAFGEADISVFDGENLTVARVQVKDDSQKDFIVSVFYHSSFLTADKIEHCFDLYKAANIGYVEGTRSYDIWGNDLSMYTVFLCAERDMCYSVCCPDGASSFLEKEDEEIISVVQKYEHRRGFYGIYLQDEPHEEYIRYAEIFRTIRQYNPHIVPGLNLLPPYNFGGNLEYFPEFAAVAGGDVRMKYLSYDHYPFMYNGGFNTQVYESLNMLRTSGLKYNASTAYYLQAMEITNAYRIMSDEDLMYNASFGIAYGMKHYKWFVALTPINSGEAFTMGLLDKDFNPTSMYGGVTKANEYILACGKVLGSSDAFEVYHTNPEGGAEAVPGDFALTPISRNPAMLTLYAPISGEGRQHIVVTNKRFSGGIASNFSLSVKEGLTDIEIFNGTEFVPAEIVDGRIDIKIESGSNCIIRLPEGYDARRSAEPSDNKALGCGIFVSSSQATFWQKGNVAAYYMSDGSPEGGYWISDKYDRDPEVIVDLGGVCEFEKLVFSYPQKTNSRFMPSELVILVSEDGKNYTEVANPEGIEYHSGEDVQIIFEASKGRYIKITTKKSSGLCFSEIEVY